MVESICANSSSAPQLRRIPLGARARTMPTRRVLKSVAHDVGAAIISRNDDVGGYWALGQLLSYALAIRTGSFAIDLTCGASSPPLTGSPVSTLPSVWSEVFWKNVEHQRLHRALVARASAGLQIDFARHRDSTRGAGPEYHVTCLVEVQDDRGKVYSRSADIWCSPHDSSRDLKRARGA